MNKQKLAIISILIITAISVASLTFESYVYTRSDITKANPSLKVSDTDVSMATDLDGVKQYVVLTVSGKVVSVGDPIPWVDDAGNKHGGIPITIQIDKKNQRPN